MMLMMRGDIVYRVYGVHGGREEDINFGTYRSLPEAEARVQELMSSREWVEHYHNRGFLIRTSIVETDFETPSLPKPRDRYFVRARPKPNRPGTWDSTMVEVLRRDASGDGYQGVCEYERNYSMLRTFEPFRQGTREYALISRDYTKTVVLDLTSGRVIAEEMEEFYDKERLRPGAGFCPVGFYVPDWWDVHDGSIIPGDPLWDEDDEWPKGDFGFVWGCHWGDDSSWKVQYLDLSRVAEGIIRRDDRFGYVELATIGHHLPTLNIANGGRNGPARPPEFIRVSKYKGIAQVTFAVETTFDLTTGKRK
jgi:hypothetical protein